MELTFTGGLTRNVPVEDATQIGHARRVAQQVAQQIGFDEGDAGRVALVATELASNVLRHARGGEIHIAIVPGHGTQGVEVTSLDRGPGFVLAECLPDGYSTAGSRGEGLGAIQRQAQVMDMYADARGAVVMTRLYPRAFPRADVRFGATQQLLADEPVCGDGWAFALCAQGAAALVVDGLGHGPAAHEAASACAMAFMEAPCDEPVETMGRLGAAMSSTRGGAVALARYDAQADRLRFTGIGNVSASLQSFEGSRGLASHPGIVGGPTRRAQAFDFPEAGGKLLLMHSDGLQSRWSLRDYPGLLTRHPAVITALLYRDFSRGRDDVTVFAIALEGRA
ncbi:MAG: Serine/threonine-protein kinase RsbT [Luteibacter sp.]|uniref:ATP-binding protein n=1 Tax=Luteibacter sp. TaxID=1886636 RepID=UPI001382F92F|nr:ATP-binding protein [Luteibacter sp.]KAF1007860.1 MAG: Serine/threonine-protein kinase RsbT [Luteibacter sp.]